MLQKMVIEGGVPLRGGVRISGSKNAALPILIASIMAPGRSKFLDVPDLMDIKTTKDILTTLGAEVSFRDAFVVDTSNISEFEAPWDHVRKMRASFLVLGALISRFGRAKVSQPGGCELGVRPVDQHLKGFLSLGVDISEEHGFIIADAKRLRGGRVVFDLPTVGATENIMMAAVTAKGETVIKNAAKEPEVIDLASALKAMGAKIEGAGDDTIHISGVDSLSPLKDYRIIPDRIEAGTFMIASAITGGDIVIENCPREMLSAVIKKLKDAGVDFSDEGKAIRVKAPRKIKGTNLKTLPYPGFPTDLQAPFTALMTLSDGRSKIRDTIFEKRFAHIPELIRLGADITIKGKKIVVRGVKGLSGAKVMSSDLRNSASLVLAGLAAKNTTEVYRIYHLDRGYERMEEKLKKLGARIKRGIQDD
jgi:UDP-N-acetylglucosamine 1-carboxyvinyltransferase